MIASKLLDAAVEYFGRYGFDGASTRDIAKACGTGMSSITYHFGGKQGLYIAAAEHIARPIVAICNQKIENLKSADIQSPDQAKELLLDLADTLAQMIIRPEAAARAQFIIRELLYPTEAFECLYEGIVRRMLEAVTRIVAYLRPNRPELEVRVTVLLMLGEILSLRLCQAMVCRVLEVETFSPHEEKLMRAELRANIWAIMSDTAP